MKSRTNRTLGILALSASLAACATNPATGKSDLMLVGESEELEVTGARTFVRLANDTAKQAAAAVANGVDPRTAAQNAAVNAARKFAPGLVGATAGAAQMQSGGYAQHKRRPTSGRWVRQGHRILVYGV